MAQTTYKQFCESIRMRIYNGVPNQDAEISINQIFHDVLRAIAYYAKVNYFETGNIQGEVNFLNDGFLANFENVPVLENTNTKKKYAVLPNIPIGLPHNMGVVSVSAMEEDDCSFTPIKTKDVGFMKKLPSIRKQIFYNIENGNIVFRTREAFNVQNILVKMAGSGSDIDSVLTCPQDVLYQVEKDVLQLYVPLKAQGNDKLNDGRDLNQNR